MAGILQAQNKKMSPDPKILGKGKEKTRHPQKHREQQKF